MDRPELRLRLLGYRPGEANAITQAVASLDARWRPAWVVTEDEQADAYLLCCAAVFDRIQAWANPQPTGVLDLSTVRDTSSQSDAQVNTVGLRDALIARLLRLEIALRGQLSAYRMGAAVYMRHALGEPPIGLWHLNHGNKLVAVVDFERRMVAFDRQATSDELNATHWAARPPTAAAPLTFMSMRMSEAMWCFTRYCPEDLMTARYHNSTIRLKRLPTIPVSQVTPQALQVIDLLKRRGAMTYGELAYVSGLQGRTLGNTVAGLFFTGALRTNTPGARRPLARTPEADSPANGTTPALSAERRRAQVASQFLVSEIGLAIDEVKPDISTDSAAAPGFGISFADIKPTRP